MAKQKPIINRYAGRCTWCGCTVRQRAGVVWSDAGTWHVAHEACWEAEGARLTRCRYHVPARYAGPIIIRRAQRCRWHAVEVVSGVPLCADHAETVAESRARRGARIVRHAVPAYPA